VNGGPHHPGGPGPPDRGARSAPLPEPGRPAGDAGSAPPPGPAGVAARLPGRRSLRRKLVWSFALVAVLVALVTGVTTLSLLRQAGERDLQQRLETVVRALVDEEQPTTVATLCQTRRALRAGGTEVYLVLRGGRLVAPPCPRIGPPLVPVPGADVDRADAVGSATGGVADGVVWAVTPVRSGRVAGILLARPAASPGLPELVARRLVWGTLLAVAAAVGVAWVLSGRLAAPLGRLAVAARSLGAGRLDTRVSVEGDDEVAEVATAFNEMAASLERHEGEQRAFLSSVGHELRTPLTVVQGNAEALLDGAVDGEAGRRRSLERLHAETLRLARLVDDLLDLGRLGRGRFRVDPVDTDAAAVFGEAGEVAAQRGSARGVSVEVRLPGGPLPARIDPGRLRQVLDNLLDNAVRSNPPGRPVLLAARRLPDGRVEAAVADQGPGIAPEDLPRAFERGYLWSRYRDTRTVGSGLGLAIVRALCDAMGVRVRAGQSAGGGLAVHLVLPAPAPPPRQDTAGTTATTPPPARQTPRGRAPDHP
jgi:two-component system OmpR family sensor kinase